MMEILAYICKNKRRQKSQDSPKKSKGMIAIIISGASYLIGIFLLLWSAPNMWAFVFGHLLLLVGGYRLGKQLAMIMERNRKSFLQDDQSSS